jgi:hypothetical protein
MRTLLSMLVLTSLFLTVSCSDAVSPATEEVSAVPTGKSGSAPSIQPIFIKYDDIKGEVEELYDAMDIYSGQGAETCGLLLPAVQKVREAAAKMEEETDRNGDLLAKDAYKIVHQAIRSFNPPENAYELKDLIVTSLNGRADPTRGNSVDLSPYGNEHDKNVEYLLWHIFNGVRIELENAGVDDRLIDAELGQLMGTIEALS